VTRGDLSASKEEIITTPLPDNAPAWRPARITWATSSSAFGQGRPNRPRRGRPSLGSICHLAAIALRLRRKLRWDADKETFVGDGASEANAFVAREMRKPYDYGFI